MARARELFEEGLRLDPTHGPLYNAYANMEARHHRVGAARAVLKRGVENSCSDMAHVWHGLAVLELRQGNIDEARRMFSHGIERFAGGGSFTRSSRKSEDATFLVHSLGTLEMQLQNYAEACAVFADGIRLYPNNSHLLLGAGLTEMRMNEIERARELFRRAVKADVRHAHAWQAWGVMEAKQQNVKAARALFENGLREVGRFGAGCVAKIAVCIY